MEYHVVANRSNTTAEQRRENEKKFNIHLYHADISRSPFSFSNIKAYRQICNLIKQQKIDYIHCNTPVGALLGRLCGKKCKVKKVLYQAHGFHFYKGAPKKNWILFYPVEKWLAHHTDAIITMNLEDKEIVEKFRLRRGGKKYYLAGVGIDVNKFKNAECDRTALRNEIGVPEDKMLIISAGELNQNKNNAVVIKALSHLPLGSCYYAVCGVGEKEEELRELANELGVGEYVKFLGYRTDIPELYKASDVFVMSSFREGLSRSIMEAMASGLPCVVSKIRGNTDLIKNEEGGILCAPSNVSHYASAFERLLNSPDMRERMSSLNSKKADDYDFEIIGNKLLDIYREVFLEE
jgi:glycosyltransferase involved in cell wall biosynthesis